MTDEGRFEAFCVVGMGAHARSKLLPAIEANGQALAAVVSGKSAADLPACPTFPTLEAALRCLPHSVAVLVATPPQTHAELAACAVANGFDVILEKPAFVTLQEAASVRAASEGRDALVIEALMHEHTTVYPQFVAQHRGKRLGQLSVSFTIPEAPPNTFRDGRDIGASSLYDIGCYAVALVLDLGLDPDDLHIEDVRFPGDPRRELLHIGGASPQAQISLSLGVASAYKNSVSCSLASGERIDISPFFYGRSGEREVRRLATDGVSECRVIEANAFERMLATTRGEWRRTAEARWTKMLLGTQTLERLGQELAAVRERSNDGRRGVSSQAPE
jgi:predicted dehydrogenase